MSKSLCLFLTLGLVTLACYEPSLDLSGRWEGSARLFVDGEEKVVPLSWELAHSKENLGGTIIWDTYRREITSASVVGPKVLLVSASDQSTITFKGLFKNDRIEGEFAIRYSLDPEAFPGRFALARGD